ncbi:MAG TPA: YihY family inner membrane protein [Burkholderiaceae bacterium]|nr:YihY family inner membrane protein [Burkholderiaceae bacterium]
MATPSVTPNVPWYARAGARIPRLHNALARVGPWLDHARDVVAFAGRRARAVRLSEVAGSLTFTTVLSLVPLLAVALAVFSAFPLFAEYRSALEKTLITNLVPEQISSVILRYLKEFSSQATRLTAVGLAFLFAAALLMILTVDRVLNDIWQVRQRRPLAQRVLIYWALITIGPLLVGGSLALTSYLGAISGRVVQELPPIVHDALDLVPLAVGGFAFAAMYVFVPNRPVLWRDALVGSFVASALSEAAKAVFALYIARGTYQSIYGAFAALPVFLLWVYISWWVTLFGAAIAATLPMLRLTRFADETRAGNRFVTSVALLAALYHALVDAKEGGRMTTKALALHVRTYPEQVERLLNDLEGLGYVAPLDGRHVGEWLLTANPAQANLVPLFGRHAVDPSNTLITRDVDGLATWMTDGLAADWIRRPLAELFAQRTVSPSGP